MHCLAIQPLGPRQRSCDFFARQRSWAPSSSNYHRYKKQNIWTVKWPRLIFVCTECFKIKNTVQFCLCGMVHIPSSRFHQNPPLHFVQVTSFCHSPSILILKSNLRFLEVIKTNVTRLDVTIAFTSHPTCNHQRMSLPTRPAICYTHLFDFQGPRRNQLGENLRKSPSVTGRNHLRWKTEICRWWMSKTISSLHSWRSNDHFGQCKIVWKQLHMFPSNRFENSQPAELRISETPGLWPLTVAAQLLLKI